MSLNSGYKEHHRPDMSGKSRTKQGYYQPLHPEKYIGNPTQIIFRSGWEFAFCKWCDISPSIVRWSSEPIKVQYYDKVTKLAECKRLGIDPNLPSNWLVKNYNIDFWVEVKKDDAVEKWFIEIKPAIKLRKPIPPDINASLKEQKAFVYQAKEYVINEEKWKAMNSFAIKHGCKFFVFTENELTKLGALNNYRS